MTCPRQGAVVPSGPGSLWCCRTSSSSPARSSTSSVGLRTCGAELLWGVPASHCRVPETDGPLPPPANRALCGPLPNSRLWWFSLLSAEPHAACTRAVLVLGRHSVRSRSAAAPQRMAAVRWRRAPVALSRDGDCAAYSPRSQRTPPASGAPAAVHRRGARGIRRAHLGCG